MTSAGDQDLLGTTAAGPAAIRGGALRVAGYALGVVLTVGSAAALFRHLGVDDSGRYVLVLSLVTLFGGITDAGLSTIGVREIAARGGMELGRLLRNLLGLRLVFTGVGALLACVYAVLAGYDRVLVLGTAVAGVGLMLTALQSALATVLLAELRFGWVTVVDLLRQVLTAVGTLTLVVLGASLLPFFFVVVVAAGAALGLTARLVRGVPARPAYDRAAWSALLRDTLPFALAAAVGAVYFRLSILMVDQLADPEQTGFFGASFRIVEVLVVVPQLAIGAAFPIFSRAASDDLDRLRYAVQRTFEASLLLGVLVAIGLGVGAAFVIAVVAGPDFAPAAAVLRLHAVALLAAFVGSVFGYALLAVRRHRAVLVMNAGALLVVAVAGALLIPDHGARGAALATALSEGALALLGFVALARSGALRRGLSLAIVPRAAVAAAVAVGAALLLDLPSGVEAAISLVLFAGLALLLRAVPDELLVEARGVIVRLRASRAAR